MQVKFGSGFTLIELLVVMALLGVLSATVALNAGSLGAVSVGRQGDELRRNIAHAQLMAMNWGVVLQLTVAANGTGYGVTCVTARAGTPCAAVGAVPVDPATGAAFAVTLRDGVTIGPAGNTMDIDSLGRPIAGTALITDNPAQTYTLTGGTRTSTVTVLPITGFAQAS